MAKHSLGTNLRQEVLARDNFRCVKCGRSKKLEVHHILPVYKDGPDVSFNLITLCRDCHDNAPNNPIDFVKYCSRHLPDSFFRSSQVAKVMVMIILQDLHVYDFGDYNPKPKTLEEYYEATKNTSEIINKRFALIDKRIDELYDQIWGVFLSDRIDYFSSFISQVCPKVVDPTVRIEDVDHD